MMQRVIGRRDGVAMLEAHFMAAGIALAKSKRPHLILMDFILPGMAGIDTLRALRIMKQGRTT